jgi:hypothetical protein
MSHDLDRIQLGRVQRKNALDSYPIGDFAYRKRPSSTSTTEGDNDAFKSLYTLAIAINEPDLHAHGIASAKLRKVLFHLRLLEID